MKINGNEIRVGNIIEHKNRLWMAVKTEHVKPGKGGAYAQVELKDVRDGTKLNERFRSSETVERVRMNEREYQFLFLDGNQYTFMDQDTFDQVTIDDELIGEQKVFLQEGMIVKVSFYHEEIIGVLIPDQVTLVVVETEPVIKGQTATSSFKPAILDNGVRIMVPPHVNADTRVVVNTADSTYIERAKD
jgi:elongation factor P